MIIVIGSVEIKEGHVEEALALSLDHVHRSRTEPGCLSHDVHLHAENPNRLVFVERWVDHDSLMAHFAVPASSEFVKDVTALAASRTTIEVFEANEVRPA